MNRDREFIDNAREEWGHFKTQESLSGGALATAIALWASLNVDHLIALAEHGLERKS